MESINDTIIELLRMQKYTKRYHLRLQLTSRGFYLSDREVRKHVEQLIKEEKFCIQSSAKGYSLIITKDDLEKAVSYLDKKSASISIRKNCLLRNFAEGKLNEQLPLFA